MTTTLRVAAATLNMFGHPAPGPLAARRRGRANVEAVKDEAWPIDFAGLTERWPYGYGIAIQNGFPDPWERNLPMYGRRRGWSEGGVLNPRWTVTSFITRRLHGPVVVGKGVNRKVVSDERHLVGFRAVEDTTDQQMLFGVFHLAPLGAWAGAEAMREARKARTEATANLIDLLGDGGAPALLLGDKNMPTRVLPHKVLRRQSGTPARAQAVTVREVGGGATECGYFVDGIGATWGEVSASHFPAPYVDHHKGGLRMSGTLTRH